LPDWYFSSPTGDLGNCLLAIVRGRLFYLDYITAVWRRNVPGSWTQKYKTENFQKDHLIKRINTLDMFNDFTNRKFCEYIPVLSRR